jgi:hypothetical protein
MFWVLLAVPARRGYGIGVFDTVRGRGRIEGL